MGLSDTAIINSCVPSAQAFIPLFMTFSQFFNFKLKQESHSLGVTQKCFGESPCFLYTWHSPKPSELRRGVVEARRTLLQWHMVCTALVFPLVVQRAAIKSRRGLGPTVRPEFWELAAYAARVSGVEVAELGCREVSEELHSFSLQRSQEKLCLFTFIYSSFLQQMSTENRCLCKTIVF